MPQGVPHRLKSVSCRRPLGEGDISEGHAPCLSCIPQNVQGHESGPGRLSVPTTTLPSVPASIGKGWKAARADLEIGGGTAPNAVDVYRSLHQPRAPAAAPLEPPSAVQVRTSPFPAARDTSAQPSALLPAPRPRMSCPLRWCSPWPELRLRHPDPLPCPRRARSWPSGRAVILRPAPPGPSRS